jgi:hypothetical protein
MSAMQEKMVRSILNMAAVLNKNKADHEAAKRKTKDPKAHHIIDKNIEHLQSAEIHLRHAAESVSKMHM